MSKSKSIGACPSSDAQPTSVALPCVWLSFALGCTCVGVVGVTFCHHESQKYRLEHAIDAEADDGRKMSASSQRGRCGACVGAVRERRKLSLKGEFDFRLSPIIRARPVVERAARVWRLRSIETKSRKCNEGNGCSAHAPLQAISHNFAPAQGLAFEKAQAGGMASESMRCERKLPREYP